MRIIEPYIEIPVFDAERKMRKIEEAGRTCYKSEGAITPLSYQGFIEKIIKSGHESVLEHEKLTVRFIIDRGVSHEIVRHRIASYSQESTRYCNYAGDKFGNEITVIKPWFFKNKPYIMNYWETACRLAENSYIEMLNAGCSPQEARSVLPNSLKTEIVVTANLREWRHFFRLRAAKAAHPQMQQVAIPLLLFMQRNLTPVFQDIGFNQDFPREHYAEIIIL
jgi:thymidylate synthase (FAD)